MLSLVVWYLDLADQGRGTVGDPGRRGGKDAGPGLVALKAPHKRECITTSRNWLAQEGAVSPDSARPQMPEN